MKFLMALFILTALSACKSNPTLLHYEMACQGTPVNFSDLYEFGLQPMEKKVTVVRILRTTCPSCRSDLDQIAARFQKGDWKPEHMQLVLIGYKKPGMETRATFDAFVRERLGDLGIPLESVQMVWLNKSFAELIESKNKHGRLIFANWKAVPYGMVFAADGHLVFRGQFTMSQETQDEHYAAISRLQDKSCRN